MRVDFYQAGRDPAEEVVALLARNTLRAGKRLLVVCGDETRLAPLGEAMWNRKDGFLANGVAGGGHDARQPILLSRTLDPANGACFVALADGLWRDEVLENPAFERVFLVFDEATVAGARACWRQLGARAGVERNFWKQDGGRWIQAA